MRCAGKVQFGTMETTAEVVAQLSVKHMPHAVFVIFYPISPLQVCEDCWLQSFLKD